MDLAAAWSKITPTTKIAVRFSASQLNRAADAVVPVCAPFAHRWDAEADRRRQQRTPEHLRALMDAQREHNAARAQARMARSQRSLARKNSRNPLSAARRSAAVADRAADKHVSGTKSRLRAAKRDYPLTLTQLAVRAHTAHSVPAALASYVLSTPQDWALWPAASSVALMTVNAGALWFGRRKAAPVVDEGATAEERALMERFHPTYWTEHADDRGLGGTVTGIPTLTPAGVVVAVRLDGRWSVKELRGRADAVRALVGMRTGTRMDISAGVEGNWAQITVRTRSAADGVSLTWAPDYAGIGMDEVTGEIVDLPLTPGVHILAAGITGMGKSVSWRPLVMRAVMSDEWTAIVIDPKRQEAIGWQHCLRCVGQETDREERMARIYGMAKELTREMHRRQGMASGSAWVPDGRPENRKLLVVIDEGAAIVRMAKDKRYADVMDLFEELWSEARSVGFQFIWATQFPTKSVGVPAAVKENMSARLSLTVNPGEAERAIFGETAGQEGWLPSRLDGIPGRAMLQFRKRSADPIRLWHVTDETVAALPAAEPWHDPRTRPADSAAEAERPALRLVKDGDYHLAPPAPATEAAPAASVPAQRTEAEAAVLDAIRAAGGPVRQKDVVAASGLAKGTVSKAVNKLIAAGAVRRADDGALSLGTTQAGEVSA